MLHALVCAGIDHSSVTVLPSCELARSTGQYRSINDDEGLEEAGLMGEQAVRATLSVGSPVDMAVTALPLMMQRKSDKEGNKLALREEVEQANSFGLNDIPCC